MTLIAARAGKSRTRTGALSLLLGLSTALAIASFAAPAYGSVADEQREGQQILRSVDGGDRRCSDLSNADFERVGEYVMGRMAGSTRAHEQMNQLMANMMGGRGTEQMHEFMGRRFTGCGGSRTPGGFGSMMGSMGMMGGAMMGGGSGAQSGYGSMMGRASSGDEDDDWDGGPAAIVMIVLMAALLAVVTALLLRGSRRRGTARSPLDILDDRYARGEIDSDDYEQRRQALGGGD